MRRERGEQIFRISVGEAGLEVALTLVAGHAGDAPRPVLCLHGATFPSSSAVAYRFDDGSWRDALADAGFDVWCLDFVGFGRSDRYPQMDSDPEANAPLGLAAEAKRQVEAAARFILDREHVHRLSLVSHSWGSMPAGLFAAEHPTMVDRIVMFAPIAQREGPRYTPRPTLPAWKIVTLEDQWKRFVEDVPDREAVLSRSEFEKWGETYLESDAGARDRHPPGVKTPTGPLVEILRAWHGELAWDPSKVEAPVAIVRGAWDGLVTDEDARWLWTHLSRSRELRDIKIGRGTHLLHLEQMRSALWRESIAFLKGNTMKDHHETKDLPGYNPGSPEVAKSPISMKELAELKASAFFNDEDVVYLRLSYDVLKDQAEDLVTMWRGIIAQHQHLARYSQDPETGEPDKEYGAKVGKRFAQWVLDTARAEYDEKWLDYQYEIGLRHHRTKKNVTDGAHTAAHIRGRDLLAFAAATVAPMRPYLEKGGHSAAVVHRMQEAWWKSMILQVTLWSQPYMNPGDF